MQTLNEEWITRYFDLEAKHRETLGDPGGAILRKGGHIFVVDSDSEAVGCAALIPMGGAVYELLKMAVLPRLRGLGIGATSLFLGSSTKLANSIHIYESVGFRHVAPEENPAMPDTRADV